MSEFLLPDLGEGLEEAEIVSWHVGVGDRVVGDQPLLSVETAKAVVEIPSPQAGQIKALHGKVGDTVRVGSVIVEFEAGEVADSGTVVGRLDEAPKSAAARPPTPARASGAAQGIRAMPAARALAEQEGIDLAGLTGSGPGGTITRADVVAAVESGPAEPGEEVLHGVRRAMAQAMARSGAEVVPATVSDEAVVDAWPEKTRTTLRLVAALVAGCRAEPALNAWFDGRKMSRRLHSAVDIGIAVDTPDGLFVPVVRDAGDKSAEELAAAFDKLKRAVRDRSIAPEALARPTITLSNFGTLGGRYGALVIVPPQVAILGAGRIAERVVAEAGKPVVRRTLPLSLTFDHRAVTGGEAARFLAAVAASLEGAEET